MKQKNERWHRMQFSVEGVIRGIEQGYISHTDIEQEGIPANSKAEALKWLQDCIERGITAI